MTQRLALCRDLESRFQRLNKPQFDRGLFFQTLSSFYEDNPSRDTVSDVIALMQYKAPLPGKWESAQPSQRNSPGLATATDSTECAISGCKSPASPKSKAASELPQLKTFCNQCQAELAVALKQMVD